MTPAFGILKLAWVDGPQDLHADEGPLEGCGRRYSGTEGLAEVDLQALAVAVDARNADAGDGAEAAEASSNRRLVALRDAGKALLLVSVELDEILALADRILVMHDGRIAGDVPGASATEQTLGRMMAGVCESNAHGDVRCYGDSRRVKAPAGGCDRLLWPTQLAPRRR